MSLCLRKWYRKSAFHHRSMTIALQRTPFFAMETNDSALSLASASSSLLTTVYHFFACAEAEEFLGLPRSRAARLTPIPRHEHPHATHAAPAAQRVVVRLAELV